MKIRANNLTALRATLVQVIFLITLVFNSFGQGEANYWYFSTNIGLDFNSAPPTVLNAGNPNGAGQTVESSTTVSTAAGDYLFSTNGNYVFDGGLNQVATNLATTTNASQGNIVMPVPGTTDQYYVCTVDAADGGCSGGVPAGSDRGARYRIFTVSGTGAGNLTMGGESTAVSSGVAECQLAVPKTDGSDDFWWIVHERGNNTFKVYSVTAGGISLSSNQSVGFSFGACDYVSVLKSNTCYDQLALAVSGQVHLFDFDASTGTISNPSSTTLAGAYGLEFSTNGDYLYVSTNEVSPQAVYQYDISSGTFGAQSNLGNLSGQLRGGHLQLGPDGNIYAASQKGWNAIGAGEAGPLYIGVITNIDAAGATFTPNYLTVNNNNQFLSMGLPTFLKSYVSSITSVEIDGITASSTTVCEGDNVNLTVAIDGTAAGTATWIIDGGAPIVSASVNHTFSTAGSIPVQVQLTDNCGRPVDETLNIEVLPVQIPTVSTSCPGPSGTGTGPNAANYIWYDAASGGNVLATGASYSPPSAPATVWVEDATPLSGPYTTGATAAQGWGTDATTGDYNFDAAVDVIITEFKVTGALWTGGNFNVDVEIRDGSSTLIASQTGLVIAEMGETTISGLSLVVPAGTNYTMSLTGGSYQPSSGTPASEPGIITVASSDVFYDVVVEEAYPCNQRLQVDFTSCCSQPTPTLSLTTGTNPFCEGDNFTLTASTSESNPVYRWYQDGVEITGHTAATLTVASAALTDAGDYTVEVVSSDGCGASSSASSAVTITVNEKPTDPTITVNPNQTTFCEGETYDLTASSTVGSGTITYTWSGDGSGTTNPLSGTTTAGSYNYIVTATANGCDADNTASQAITVNEKPTDPTITVNPNQTTFCAGEAYDLTASSTVGSGTITYTWSGDGSGTTNPLSGTTTAGSYTYIVTATANGCDADNTASQGITVNAIPTATISGGGDICDDGVTTANLSIDFTGTAPFSVDVERNAGAFSTESTSSDPHTVTTTQDGTYTITNLSDGNCAGTTSGTATVNYYDDVVATASMECDDVNAALANDEFQIRVTVTQGDLASINITELTAHGVNFTDQGGGVWLSDAINEINSVDINVTDANDCNGGVDITGLQQQCSCPATGTITLTGSDPVCPGDNSSLEVQFSTTVGSGPFNVTVTHPISGASTTNSATSPLSITINEVGAYSATIEDVGNGCTVSAIGSVSLSNHTPPTATISGTETICNDGVTTANLSIDFTGTAPFSVDVERNAGAFSTESTSSDPHTVTTTQDGTYTITNLSDGNCAGTTSGTATVSYYDDVVATASMECDDVNAALANDEFQIRVTVTQGDLASINITELTAHGVNFTDQGGGVWLSDAVNELNSVDINVTDANDCNGGIDITGLQQQCTCPTTATATITGTNPICPGGSSTLEVSFAGGTGPFDVTLTEPSGTQNQTSVTSPATFTISDAGTYTATVTNNGDACDANTAGVDLTEHTPPTATISGTETICNDGVTTANLSIDFTGTAPFSVDVERNAGAFSTESTSSDPHTVTTTQDGTYTITNLSDGNCAGTTSGTATVSYYDDVVATASMECDDVNAALANDEFQIRVTVTQGDLASINITELTAHGVNFTDQGGGVWLSDAVNESNTVDINVTDANDCNGGIDITGLQQQCTCPTTATATITGTNPICPGGSSTLEVSFAGGTGPFDVTLTEPSGTQNQTSVTSPATFTISDAGNYTATVTNNGDACDATTTTVTLNHTTPVTPTVDISVDNNPICIGDFPTFTAAGTNHGGTPTYYWYIDGNLDGTSATASYTPSTILFDNQQVQVTVETSETCVTVDTAQSTTIIMDVENTPNPSLSTPSAICEDGQTTITASPTSGTSTLTWFLDGVQRPETGTSVTIDGTEDAGTWTVEEDNGVCPAATSTGVTAQVDNIPGVYAGTDQTFFLGNSITIDGSTTSTSGTISWNPNTELTNETTATPVFTPTTGTIYTLEMTVTDGACTATDEVVITVREPIKIPNVFTPNGDNENEVWEISGLTSYPSATLEVFNRWGTPVYKDTGIITPWDGMRSGEEMPVATYYFILTLTADDEPITGSVTLVR